MDILFWFIIFIVILIIIVIKNKITKKTDENERHNSTSYRYTRLSTPIYTVEKTQNNDMIIDDFDLFNPKKMMAKTVFNVSLDLVKSGNHSLAITSLTKAIELDASFSEAYRVRGLCYLEIKKPELAVTDFTNCIKISPNNALAYSALGGAYSDIGEYEKAIDVLNKALQLNPNDVNALTRLGVTYQRNNNFEQALNTFNMAHSIDPNDAMVNQFIALLSNTRE